MPNFLVTDVTKPTNVNWSHHGNQHPQGSVTVPSDIQSYQEHIRPYFSGLVLDCSISSALALIL